MSIKNTHPNGKIEHRLTKMETTLGLYETNHFPTINRRFDKIDTNIKDINMKIWKLMIGVAATVIGVLVQIVLFTLQHV